MADDILRNNATADDGVQHGLDDDPNNDAEKGAALGGVGGAVVGAAAGAMTGPIGAVIGAVAGGIAGAVGSGVAVAGVDAVDNDNTITGVGSGATSDVNNTTRTVGDDVRAAGHNARVAGDTMVQDAKDAMPGNKVPGVQTGGHATDGTPDTRGVMEKTADTVTGDRTDDKTGKRV